MAVPVMRMGLIGFADEGHLVNLLMTRNRFLRWERWPFADADALWVNGAHALPLREHMIRVPSGQPNKPAIVLNMREIDRPMAFTQPLGNDGLQPPDAFDPHLADSVAAVLSRFEEALMRTATQLALADELAARRHDLSSPIYHLSVGGTLAAIVNVSGDIGLAPGLTPVGIAQANWGGRPSAANAIPEGFERIGMAPMMWQYVMRNGANLLPSRYRQGLIYFRRMPAVPTKMLRDGHLVIISELKTGPQTMAQLMQGTGITDPAMGQALAALYFAGAITNDPRKAAAGSATQGQIEEWVTTPGPAPGTPIPPRPGKKKQSDMPTVPTPLEGDR